MARSVQVGRGLRAALPLIAAAALLAGAARPPDLAGYEGARWGMRGGDLLAVFGQRLERLRLPIYLADGFVEWVLRDVAIGGRPFLALFRMDAGTGRLRQVVLRPRDGRADDALHARVLAALTDRLGPPDRKLEERREAGGLAVRDRREVWVFPTTTVTLWHRAPDPAAPRGAAGGRLVLRYAPTRGGTDGGRG